MELTRLLKADEIGDDSQREQFALDVLTGLSSTPKTISSKYFYDDNGSKLFQKITQHDDYYPTKTEFHILDAVKDDIPTIIDESEIDIIELGAGDGHKSQLIVRGFLEKGVRVNFYPIDISEQAMVLLEQNIKSHKNLTVHGVVAEYFQGLRFVRKRSTNRQLILFLGSNIGNFNLVQGQGFLRRLWKILNESDFALIGFDLKKNVQILTSAYNDSAGYTRDFNLNVLLRVNNELGGTFNLDTFEHFGSYNPVLGAMESFLLSTRDQEVYISELERYFHFKECEPIHLEYSFKFLKNDVTQFSRQTGFEVVHHFTDTKQYFLDSLWKVTKDVKLK